MTTTTKGYDMITATDIDITICVDCAMWHANRDTSGTSRCDTDDGLAEFLADVRLNTRGYVVAVGDSHDWHTFDYGCDSCGSTLAGASFDATLFDVA